MGRNKNKQYQLKVQKFYKLVEQYKQTKGARQETIEMFNRCLHTVEKLRKDNFDFHPQRVSQYDYDLVAHYCSMAQYHINLLKNHK
mgnify:FL=1